MYGSVSGAIGGTCFLLGLGSRKSQGGDGKLNLPVTEAIYCLHTGVGPRGTWGTKEWARDKIPFSV